MVDPSYCCALEYLVDISPLKSLEYLYLQNCSSLLFPGNLFAPCLKVQDLLDCPGLKYLGNLDSLGSLRMLNLNECISLRIISNLGHSPLLEGLNVKGCVKLSALSQMTTDYVVIDDSRC